MAQAISVAAPLIKNQKNSDAETRNLIEQDLDRLGIQDKDVRKLLLAIGKAKTKKTTPKKRGRDNDMDRPLPSEPPESRAKTQSSDFDFCEMLDEEELATKSVVINRAPCMTAWATTVAERLRFDRAEALSLAQAYTELNAVSKGASLGLMPAPPKDQSSQPYVELMGRKVPVIALQDGKWRGLVNGQQAEPDKAFRYMQRSFRQQMGVVMGAMRLLADSFEPAELNNKGYGLYCAFRPSSEKWAEKSKLELETILNLRRWLTHEPSPSKKPKKEPEEDEKNEYDRALDDDLDVSQLPVL